MNARVEPTDRSLLALRLLGAVLVVAGVVRLVQTSGFHDIFLEDGTTVLVQYWSPTVLFVCGLVLLCASLVRPRMRRRISRDPA